ncbi:MAG TPA: type II secretion system protein [Sedimentisphaerales bacterium]|nr:type II secretion system protein [Sedimentisphaerales bacterium]
MKTRRGFTLIELLIVIAIIAVLMSILMPALNKAKLQAQDAVDKNNQHQFALIWKYYTDEHDGYFPERGGSQIWGVITMGAWPYVLYDYMPSIDRSIYLCPAATKPTDEGARCPYAAWPVRNTPPDPDVIGSYTCNFWAAKEDPDEDDPDEMGKYWQTMSIRGAQYCPILMCGNWKDSEPEPDDEPWATREDMVRDCWEQNRNEMKRVCIDRHGWFVNANFMDMSARRVGLKELWVTKWHKKWPRDLSLLPEWPAWMANCPEPF